MRRNNLHKAKRKKNTRTYGLTYNHNYSDNLLPMNTKANKNLPKLLFFFIPLANFDLEKIITI